MSIRISTESQGLAPSAGVSLSETWQRAGSLLEQGMAFTALEPRDGVASRRGDHAGARRPREERFDVVVIGAGQAGLSVGYHLARLGLRFVLLEASARVGDGWRRRWDSLRLFTPARYDSLDGMPFPAPPRSFPTKDEMADYLEHYASTFGLPVRTGTKVQALRRVDDLYEVEGGDVLYRAPHVVVAAAGYQRPRIPAFAADLDPAIRQLHSSDYRRPSQLLPGRVLLVGAGNSGAEIAMDVAASHQVWLAGRHPGHLPVRYDGGFAYHVIIPIVFRVVFHRLLSVDTPLGRKAQSRFLDHGGPLIRVKPDDLQGAGVKRVPRVVGVSGGRPVLEDGEKLEVDNVIWCTGFHPGLDWIQLPGFEGSARPRQYRGTVQGEPGLYFAGLSFQHSPSSTMIHGAARDARWIAERIQRRMTTAGVPQGAAATQ